MSEKIDVNVANAETLATIAGIGPALAERIINYRQNVHTFEEVIELAAVPGISEKMVRSFEHLVTVQPVSQGTAVPPNLDAPEKHPLLDAPEALEMLDAPPQPEGLLAAEVPTPVVEVTEESEPATVEEIAIAESVPEPIIDDEMAEVAEQVASDESVADEPEPIIEDVEEAALEEVETPALSGVEEAVSPSPPPEMEELPSADRMGETLPEPEPVRAVPPTQNADWEAKAQRRGCISTLLGATFGAILGAVLTLAILASINQGTISYSASDDALRQQLDTEIISRTNELNQISTRVSVIATQEAASNQSLQDELTAANTTLSEEIANNEEIISYLATRSGDFELRLQEVAGAADTFTNFLDGLRTLLGDLEVESDTPTPAPSEATMTPTPTPFPTNTPAAEDTSATAVPAPGQPTRTPIPTATQFAFPTNTPAPQP